MNMLKRLWNEEEGQALTEYGMIIGLIAVMVIGLVATLGDQIVSMFTDITTRITTNYTP